eukprot:Hpha_TRINITY_DN16630_c1_g1::TRINITY_DN16630_c1_g1_i6::g.178267::m.178267
MTQPSEQPGHAAASVAVKAAEGAKGLAALLQGRLSGLASGEAAAVLPERRHVDTNVTRRLTPTRRRLSESSPIAHPVHHPVHNPIHHPVHHHARAVHNATHNAAHPVSLAETRAEVAELQQRVADFLVKRTEKGQQQESPSGTALDAAARGVAGGKPPAAATLSTPQQQGSTATKAILVDAK